MIRRYAALRALRLDGARVFEGAFVRDLVAPPGVSWPVILLPKTCELNAAAKPPRRSKFPPLSSAPSVPALFAASQIRPVRCAARASAAAPIGLAAPVLLCIRDTGDQAAPQRLGQATRPGERSRDHLHGAAAGRRTSGTPAGCGTRRARRAEVRASYGFQRLCKRPGRGGSSGRMFFD